MAGVIAHNTATVSSANARVRVTLISLPRFGNAINAKVLLPIEILDHVAFICCDPRHTFRLPYRADFRGKHVRVLGSGVPVLPEDDRVRESGVPELAQEGNSFLRTRNSREPIRFTGAGFWRQRTRKDQLRTKYRSTAPDYTCKLPEDSVSCGVQIEDPVDHRNVDFFVGDGQLFRTRFAQFEITYAGLCYCLTRPVQHRRAEVDSDYFP
jgi:hypothetical protein